MKSQFKNYLYLLPLLVISIYYSFHYFKTQSAVDGGLILSNQVNFPDDFTNVKSIFLNSWTILHHFTFLFLELNLSVDLSLLF